jgi:hypothetical protein
MLDPLAIRVFRAVAKTEPLVLLKQEGSSKTWFMPIGKDHFVHFTTEPRAQKILKAGKLLQNPPHPKFGTDTVDAVSTIYGKLVPGVQFTHLPKNEKLVAISFQTDTLPKYGYIEEVKWEQDVHLKSLSIISASQAESLIRSAPVPIDENDIVLYRR